MYSGYISEVGVVAAVSDGLTVRAPGTARSLRRGGSVNINGACLSATDVDVQAFHADVSAETARRSTLAQAGPGRASVSSCRWPSATG